MSFQKIHTSFGLHELVFPSQSLVKFHFYRPRSEASEDYVFTGVCHSLYPQAGGGSASSMPLPITGHIIIRDRGVCPPGGESAFLARQTPQEGRPPKEGREPANMVNVRAVRILLKCILVITSFESFIIQLRTHDSVNHHDLRHVKNYVSQRCLFARTRSVR